MAEGDWRPWRPGEQRRIEGLDPVVGHRGAAMHAPENTLASIRKANQLGCRWVELDVKLTRDGVPILMHDEEVRRTTNGSGLVSALTFDELHRLDAGFWKHPSFEGTRIPTLGEAVALLIELDMELNLEIKPCPGREVDTALVACAELQRLWPVDRPPPLLSSFEIASLEAAQAAAPEFPRGYLVERIPPAWRETMQRLACTTLHVGHRHNSDWAIQAVAAEGVPLLCYTVNDATRARTLLDLGVATLFSDAPDRIWPVAQ